MGRKQHRKGTRATQREAQIEAIAQSTEFHLFREGPIILCSGCQSEITETDYEVGKCTQCGRSIGK